MFIYDLSIFLTSTAFVSINAKIRRISKEVCRIFENGPLGYDPKESVFFEFTPKDIPTLGIFGNIHGFRLSRK